MEKFMPDSDLSNAHPNAQTILGLCGVCPAGCLNNIELEDGKIKSLHPIKEEPHSSVCTRGSQASEIVYSPDRMLYPQRRIGARGEGRFERISWDQAYDEILAGIHRIAGQYGPEALAVYTGRGNFEYGLNETFAPSGTIESSANAVLFPFGSPNTSGVGSLCYVSYGMFASRACFGEYLRDMEEDFQNADLILIWGGNPATDSPPTNLPKLRDAARKGARVVVIDHRRSKSARALRCEWIGIRPGTDGALALAMIHVLIHEDLVDHKFIEDWTYGFPELCGYVLQFSPSKVSAITGIAEEKIYELARSIGRSKGCSILTYTGLEYSNSGLQAIRAVWTLQAIAGHLDIKGGKLFRMHNRPRLKRLLTDPPKDSRPPIGAKEFPLYREVRNEAHGSLFPRAILNNEPYPLRGLIIAGSSLITSWPDPDLWKRALGALDLLVIVNRFPTADAKYADILLPATTMFEIESYVMHDNHLILRQRVIPPEGEARNDYLIFAELARRLGYGHQWPQTESEMIEFAIQDLGLTIEDLRSNPGGIRLPTPEMHYRKFASGELRSDGEPGFNTPTGKFEISSEWLSRFGYEPLPVYIEPLEGPLGSPVLAEKFPLVLNTGARTLYDFRSQHHNIPSLVAKHPTPLVHIHKIDSEKRGIKNGERVIVKTARGEVIFTARITEDIVQGVVEVNMGGGGPLGPQEWREANVNMLTDADNFDEISGFPVYKALLCDVIKIPG